MISASSSPERGRSFLFIIDCPQTSVSTMKRSFLSLRLSSTAVRMVFDVLRNAGVVMTPTPVTPDPSKKTGRTWISHDIYPQITLKPPQNPLRTRFYPPNTPTTPKINRLRGVLRGSQGHTQPLVFTTLFSACSDPKTLYNDHINW